MNRAATEELIRTTPHAGVRWQAQMELHLMDLRALVHEAMLPEIDPDKAAFRAQLAQAHGLAAVALALVNGLGDLEPLVSTVAQLMERMAP